MNEGNNYLITRYGSPKDWCVSESDVEHYMRTVNDESRFEVYQGKEAIEYLVDYIDEKHEKEEFDHSFSHAEKALKDLLQECYGIESDTK